MKNFLDLSVCNGRKPQALLGLSYHPRHDLLARLMKKRNHLRVLVSPSLYGKTSLALEYAETAFAFENVFWLDGKSPCFLRDLDKGLIASSLLAACEEGGLLVIDDFPDLDTKRREAFEHVISTLQHHSWEIMLCVIPSNDYFTDTAYPVMKLDTQDFLLPASLIDAYRLPAERQQRKVEQFSEEERIAAMFWSPEKGPQDLLEELTKEELPDQVLLGMFVVLTLKKGSTKDIFAFFSTCDEQALLDCLHAYAHLGIKLYEGVFDAHEFKTETLSKYFLPLLPRISACAQFPESECFAMRLADVLLAKHESKRACELVQHMTMPEQRRTWLAERGDCLAAAACFLPAYRVYESLRTTKDAVQLALMMAHAQRLEVLGEAEQALVIAKRVLKAQDAQESQRAQAILLLVKICKGSAQMQAIRKLRKIARINGVFDETFGEARVQLSDSHAFEEWKMQAILELCLHDHIERVFDFLEYCVNSDFGPHQITKLLLRVSAAIIDEQGIHESEQRLSSLVSPLHVMAYEHVVVLESSVEPLTYHEVLLIKNMEKLQDLDLSEAYDMLPVSLRETASFYEMNVFSQKREFAEEHKSGSGGFRTEQASVPAEIEQVVPGISIQLFGGFTVRRDGLEMDPDLFSRQKVKILLAILAIEQGKDVPCDRLASLMWPDSDPLDARKNLQSTWSLLRKALKTPQGTCPYLRKSPFSYQLTDYFVITDVSIFKDLCRKVQFESSESTEWAHVSMRLDDVYRGELFPTEQCNDAIVSARRDCEMRLVNCCFQAGLRLFDLKDYEMAIWFLQKTISHDPTREDAYQLMMRAQLELGQRAAAIETFFRCEKRMHENLGIRPGPRIRMLYQEIIMESKNEKSLLKQLENNAIDGL